jgi:type VI protein secretion system component VasK
MPMDFTISHLVEIGVFVFACGMAYYQFQANAAMLKEHTAQLKALEKRMNQYDTNNALNLNDHSNIKEQLERIEKKLDPIIEIAVRGNEHMSNKEIHNKA